MIFILALLTMLIAVVTTFVVASASDLSADEPLATFEISQDGATVVVMHTGGDVINGETLYIVSESDGSLGNYAGTDGQACDTVVSTARMGTRCQISGFSSGKLYVVWRSDGHAEVLFRGVASSELER
jgi:hypothetical protein